MSCGDEQLFACAVRDLSSRRQIEAQLRQAQKMEAVGQLTGGIAHDFNNLLTIVIGNLQLLDLEDSRIEDRHKLREAALDAAMRGAELTRRLLAFSRQQVLTPKVLRVNDLVRGIVPLLERTLGEVITLHTVLSTEVWTTRVDPSQLENSLVNLAINARDAMPAGGRLTVETSNGRIDQDYAAQYPEVEPGDYVRITVSDSGSGIPNDVLPHVFDPFFSTKDTGKGSGLGLSMVHGFVKQSAGHIRIYSERGHGTLVNIYLPRSRDETAEDLDFTASQEGIPCGDETILVVEDEQPVRELAKEMLTLLGYKVIAAETGADALQVLAGNSEIDLLVTDIVMPGGMTGAELAQAARERWPALRMMFTSGYTNAALFDNGLLSPDDVILTKPYRREELARRVREVLDSGDRR
jgi:nitrogen-specific signal transduction histidine kinase